jgi:hypothetical protein
MRELHGVMFAGRPNINMKRFALLFDKFQIWRYVGPENERTEEFEAEILFLKERGLVVAPSLHANDFADANLRVVEQYSKTSFAQPSHDPTQHIMIVANGPVARDLSTRAIAAKVPEQSDCEVVPICEVDLPTELLNASYSSIMRDIVTVAIEKMPTPDDSCAWQDILDFKAEMHDKRWHFRRFLQSVATQKQSEAEMRDNIEWTLNEYAEGMKRCRMKVARSAIAAFLIPAVDLTFNTSGNHAAALLAAGIAINRLRVELLEGEMKAPGRECAYVFEAQRKFGRHA